MNPLPIAAVLPAVKQTLTDKTNLVLSAPPGAGKTTGVPPALLEESWLGDRKILMLEPRRLAARTAADRIARMLGEPVGRTVGYRTRLDTRVAPATRIEIVTEGILTRLLQNDPTLERIGLVIFDEFHERSLHADLGLALCLEVRAGLREDLRLMVMSATLDTRSIARLLGDAPVIESRGRMFPVETRFAPGMVPGDPVRNTAAAIAAALREETGSILVFLPGGPEIRGVHRRLANAGLPSDVSIVPLYGTLGREAQERAIAPAPPGTRKVVLASAIAETSLTIEGVSVVIDAGLMRVPRFDPRTDMTRLVTLPVSRDSADQRRGRAGRTAPGICYRLWSREADHHLMERSSPEILSVDLAPLALELATWGVSTPAALSWIDPPPDAAFSRARALLGQLGAIDDRGHITTHGKQMAALGLHPRLSHMVLTGREAGMGALACEVAAVLGERDFLISAPGGRDSDLRLRIEALRVSPRRGGREFHDMQVDRSVRRLIEKTAMLLKTRLGCTRKPTSPDAAGILLALAYPDRIGVRRSGDAPRYLLSNGMGAYFTAPEPLSAAAYLVAAELDGDRRESKIFLGAPVRFEELISRFEDRITERQIVSWDRRSQTVSSRRQMLLGKAVLKDFPLTAPDPDRVTAAMCEGIRQMGLGALPWKKPLRTWQARVLLMREIDAGGISWPDVSDARLLDALDTWLLPHLSGIATRDQLSRLDLKAALFPLLTWKQQSALDRLAPTHITVPSGSRIPVTYVAGDPPVLAVRLQEMFGARDTPTIAGGALPLLLHLLSPAGRPVQVTRNLKSFWENAYFDVKKDLKGRYPKHHWPDDPLAARPTSRTKRK